MAINKKTNLLFLLIIVLLTASNQVAAQTARLVYINGTFLNSLQLAILDQLNCNTTIPNGRYWINFDNLQWGFEGGPAEGLFGECYTVTESEPARSSAGTTSCEEKYTYFEDRMCNCYGVC